MLHIIVHASEPSGSEEEDFLKFSMYLYGTNPGPPEVGPVLTRRPPLET